MAVNYKDRVSFLNDGHLVPALFDRLPDTCPICSYSISPTFLLVYDKENGECELLCGCPRHECASLFFARYERSFYGTGFELLNLYPINHVDKLFPKGIDELSPNFVEIYNQALQAEQENLNQICGVGYRKALEFLIKDYVIKLSPNDMDNIKKITLQNCIQQYITETNIKAMAERATWLGNDETHYERKWENKDLQDLKNLIDLTVNFINYSLDALRYQQEMAVGKK